MTDGVCINVILLTIIICLPWDELSGVHYMCMLAIWLANDVSSSFCSIVERRKIFVCARCTLRSKPRISCVGFFLLFCLSFYCAQFFIFVTLRPLHHHWCVGILPLLVVAAEFRTDTPSDMRYACACFASFAVFHRSKSTVLTEQTVDFTK